MADYLFVYVFPDYDSVPVFTVRTYIPFVGGIPSYLFGWFAHTAVTFTLIIVYFRMCMKRKEYHVYDEDEKEKKEEK